MPDNQIDIEVIVNGQPTTIHANKNAPLHSIIGQALAVTGDRKIESFSFPANVKLFLNLKAGVGGQ
jgi:hypothetical protein